MADSERVKTQREMVTILKERLEAGTIKVMEMRLLDDLLKELEYTEESEVMSSLNDELPFETDQVVVK